MTYQIKLIPMRCIRCGCFFAVDELVVRTHWKTGGYHACPQGHSQGWENKSTPRTDDAFPYKTTDMYAITVKVEDYEAEIRQLKSDLAHQRLLASIPPVKSQKPRSSQCTICNKFFTRAGLTKHMKEKHPQEAISTAMQVSK